MTEPLTAETITSDQLNALYDRLAEAEQEADDSVAAAARLTTLVGKRSERAERAAEKQRRRADIAETELRVLRSGLRANGADPTQIQNLWAQIRLRNRQWREAEQRAEAASRLGTQYMAAAELAEAELQRYAEVDSADAAAGSYAHRAEQAEAERDGAYRERAHLLALLAALHPSVIAPAPDVNEDGWQILYLQIGGKQASWHIAPRDAELYAHVEHVAADDRRAQWDGHTTEQKYTHIGEHTARLYAEARGRAETPANHYRFATTWSEYHAGRAALDEPTEG